MANQIVVSSGAKVRDLNDVIIGTSGVLSSLAFNVSNGVPKLDVNGKILVSQLPNSVMEYLGTWNAATNTPFLVNGTGNAGDVYLCNVAGTVDFGAGPISFVVSDQVIYSGTIWQKASGSNGTVTSVAVTESGDSLNITGSPITTSGTINIGFNGTNLQYINGAGDLTTFPTLLSSVGLSMPSAFSVSNSPLTANGTIAVTGAGYPSQYIRGDGTLADFPTSGGGGSSVSYYLNGGTSQGTIGGVTYYEMSKTADTGTGVDFNKTGDGFIVAFLTDAGDPAQLNIPAGNWNYEIYASMSANGGTPQMYAELYKYDGTTFTLISTSSNEILYDGTNLNLYTFAMAVPATTLAITDRLAVKLYATNSGGKTTTVHTQDGHLCQIITTFSTGITALNGLTAQVQFFATGTSGTDFAISSSTATHTFNLPTASAANRGALSSADWTTFNNKLSTATAATTYVPYTGATANVTLGAFDLSADDVTLTSNLASLTRDVVNSIGILRLQKGANGYIQPTTLAVDRTYTLPDASGTIALTSNLSSYVPYTGATADVDLGVYNFKANRVGIASAGGSNQFTSFANTSGLHDASAGQNNFGFNTSNNIYFGKGLTGGGLGNGGVLIWSNTQVRYYTLPNADGTLALTSDLSGYLPLAGGTLTGALNGTSAVFSSTVQASAYRLTGMTGGSGALYWTSDRVTLANYNATGVVQIEANGGTSVATFGGATYNNDFVGTLRNTTSAYFATTSGNVGIGNVSASYKLDVSGTGRFIDGVIMATTSGVVSINTTGRPAGVGGGDNGKLWVKQATTGNYGIAAIASASDSFTYIAHNGTSSVIGTSYGTTGSYTNLLLQTSDTTRMTITSAGNVGIGTSSPTAKLEITNGRVLLNNGYSYQFYNTSSVAVDTLQMFTDGNVYLDAKDSTGGNLIFRTSNSNTERMRITSAGSVGINGTPPSTVKLGVFGASATSSDYAFACYTNAGGNLIYVRNDGFLYSVSAWSGSDRRLKENITDLDNGLEKVLGLKARKYDLIDSFKNQFGFIAQEVQEVIPDAVSVFQEEDQMLAIKMDFIVPHLVKAIQEMNTKLDEQNQTIQNLQEQINILAK